MNIVFYCLCAFLFVDSLVQIYATYTEKKVLRRWTKSFIVPALLSMYFIRCGFNPVVFSALILYWLGDVFLLLKGVSFFSLGGASFLSGNFVLAFMFINRTSYDSKVFFSIAALFLFWCVVVFFLMKHLRKVNETKLLIAVPFYLISNVMLNLCTFGNFISNMNLANAVIFAGSVSYLISDLTLFDVRFNLKSKTRNLKHALEMAFYIAGITLIICFC